jgi:hypothetical protein
LRTAIGKFHAAGARLLMGTAAANAKFTGVSRRRSHSFTVNLFQFSISNDDVTIREVIGYTPNIRYTNEVCLS